MADHQERFEPYHVPQQSRRDKLRILSQNQHSGALGLLQQPIYDPTTSLISSSSDLLTQSVKAEAANLMGFTNHHLYNMDPPQSSSSLSSIQLNPNPIHDINGNPFLYNPQLGLRFLHHHEETTRCGGGGQGLSLSLSSLPRELYSNSGGCFGNSNELARNSAVVPFGPFTGYASVLKGSRFLKPAQMLLEELCDLGRGIYSEKMVDDSGLMDPSLESFVDDDPQSCTTGGDQMRKKSRLMSMLHEVYKRYKQYYQQMQAVVASFESVAGVRNAAPFANLAVKAMSKHFRFLKNAITDQLQFVTESRGHVALEKDTITGIENPVMGIQNQRQLQNVGFVEHQPVWRPQRGLPERAVTVLRQWLFEHFLHPYPSDTDKIMLAKQTGLSRNQVSNWFINARVRLWKPMVEEIHLLETRQAQKEAQNTERQSNAMLASNPVSCDKKVISSRRLEDFPSKRTRNDFSAIPSGNEGAMNLPCDNSPRHPCFSVGINTAGGSGSVSLTLGLQQNNGIGLPDTFPINAARRFGLDSSGDGFVMGGIDAQNRQFGRGIIEGQILHDFVG